MVDVEPRLYLPSDAVPWGSSKDNLNSPRKNEGESHAAVGRCEGSLPGEWQNQAACCENRDSVVRPDRAERGRL